MIPPGPGPGQPAAASRNARASIHQSLDAKPTAVMAASIATAHTTSARSAPHHSTIRPESIVPSGADDMNEKEKNAITRPR